METPEENSPYPIIEIQNEATQSLKEGADCRLACTAKYLGDGKFEIQKTEVMPPEEQKPMEARSGDELDKMISDVVENPPKDQPTM